MSLRSAAVAALCAGLPAAALAQPLPVPQPAQAVRSAPAVHVERMPFPGPVTPASAVDRADPPKVLPNIPEVSAQPAPKAVEPPAKSAPAAAAPSPNPPPTACPVACPEPCGPDGRVWGRFEWLYWAGSGQSLPPLVTVAPPGTPRQVAGVLGQPTTITQFGGRRANNDFRNG